MQNQRLSRIDFLFALRHIIHDLRSDGEGPGEAFFVGDAAVEFQGLLDHAERGMIDILHGLQGFHGAVGDLGGVVVDGDRFFLRAVVHPHLVAAGALAHGADERAVAIALLAHFGGEVTAEVAIVVGGDRAGAKVVLRVVREHAERFAIERLQGDDAELRVHRTAGADDVLAEVAGVHVRTTCGLAEGIDDLLARQANPAAVVRVLPVVVAAPADASRLQRRIRRHDGLGDLRREEFRIHRVLSRAEAAHRCRRGVRVRGADHHAVHRDAALLRRDALGLINERLLHHARVHNGEGDLHLPIIEHETAHEELVRELFAPPFQKPARDDARKFRGRDVHRGHSGAEGGRGGGEAAEEEKGEENLFHECRWKRTRHSNPSVLNR